MKVTTQHRVVVGGQIVLDCLASGYPPPTYSWYKDGGRLSPAHDRFNLCKVFADSRRDTNDTNDTNDNDNTNDTNDTNAQVQPCFKWLLND